MKLREHPGISTWPLSWLALSGSHGNKVPHDSATLTNIALSRIDPITICYLTTRMEDETYMGTLLFRDTVACRTIFNLLTKNIGKAIKDIWDMDLPESCD
jgi:hypothetical protein